MSAPRIPNSEKYWKQKGKKGKKVVIYFHDDLDGIFSAIVIRNHLQKHNFEIVGYGVVNYQESWKDIEIHNNLINVAVDFSSNHPSIDIYIDHHGSKFGNDNKNYAVKTETPSAYEGICYQLGIPVDDLILSVINMVDSAKYVEYGLDFRDTLIMDKKHYYQSRLYYTASLNQMIKRGCWNTLIEVVHNSKDLSIYIIFNNFIKHYPYNNLNFKTNQPKSFIKDGIWRINEMISRTRGEVNGNKKPIFTTQDQFLNYNFDGKKWDMKGYQIIGNVAFIPTGSWANAIRARGILENDIINGVIPDNQVKFILLQYGSTLQMVCYGKIEDLDKYYLPVFKHDFIVNEKIKAKKGDSVKSIGKYMEYVLDNLKTHLGYSDISTYVGSDDDSTVAGGHDGIGTISNITGIVDGGVYGGVKYLDLIKNKIIKDFSGIEWNNIKMNWQNDKEQRNKKLVNRFKWVDDIRTEKDIKYFQKHYTTEK